MKECKFIILGSPNVGKTLLTLQFVRGFPYGDLSRQEERSTLFEISRNVENKAGQEKQIEYYLQLLPQDVIKLIDQYIVEQLPTLNFTCDDNYSIKLQVDNRSTLIKIKDLHIKERTWGTSNPLDKWVQESNVLLLLFDITNKDSLYDILPLLYRIHSRKMLSWVPVILVGAKSDLSLKREVSLNELQAISLQLNIGFFEISSKTGENVMEVFIEGVRRARKMRMIRKKCESKEYGWRKKIKQANWSLLWLPCLCLVFTLFGFLPFAVLMIMTAVKR